jgi:hypothetical protein
MKGGKIVDFLRYRVIPERTNLNRELPIHSTNQVPPECAGGAELLSETFGLASDSTKGRKFIDC